METQQNITESVVNEPTVKPTKRTQSVVLKEIEKLEKTIFDIESEIKTNSKNNDSLTSRKSALDQLIENTKEVKESIQFPDVQKQLQASITQYESELRSIEKELSTRKDVVELKDTLELAQIDLEACKAELYSVIAKVDEDFILAYLRMTNKERTAFRKREVSNG